MEKSIRNISLSLFLIGRKRIPGSFIELQQDGLLLQSVLEEIRNADKAGLGMEQTDRRLMAIVGEAQKAH